MMMMYVATALDNRNDVELEVGIFETPEEAWEMIAALVDRAIYDECMVTEVPAFDEDDLDLDCGFNCYMGCYDFDC